MSGHCNIKLVVFDLAGTTVDFGCFAPVAPFVETFKRKMVNINADEARGPMGMHKNDHIRTLLQTSDIAERWRAAHGRDWTEADVAMLFHEHFVPLQMEAVHRHAELIPGVLRCVARLRQQGIKIATTTGYFSEAAAIVYESARKQGFEPDACLCAGDVPKGRPAPWMMFRHMEALDVYPPNRVVKIGDTVPDVGEGRNAGAWTVGVTHSGSLMGLTESELASLQASDRNERVQSARKTLLDAGADYVIDTVADFPDLLERFQPT